MPGIYPRIVNNILMAKSLLHPTSKNTPRGGKIMAAMNLKISLHVSTIFYCKLKKSLYRLILINYHWSNLQSSQDNLYSGNPTTVK